MEQWSLPVTIAVWLLSSGGGEEPRDANETRQDEQARDEPQEREGTVVTARKWEEQIEDVPQSVTAVSAEELQDAHATTVRDASLLAPNVYISEFSSRRLSFPFVRGIGSGVGEPAVITYIDGVPQFGTGGTNLPLVDVERVEFLRGPQGTLWGLNALGGLVHVVTRRPGARNEIGAGATLGNHGLQEYDLGWSGPVGRDFGCSIAARYSVRDGYTENDFTGNTLDDRESVFGRTQLVYAPDGESELRLTLFGERARDGGFVLSDLDGLRDDPFHVNQDFEGETERDVISPALTFVHTGEDLELTSITAYQDWRILETSDFDFSSFDAVVRRTSESQRYWVEELRLATLEDAPMRVADDMDLRWQLGVLGFVSDANRSAQNDFRPLSGMTGVDTNRGDFDDWGVGVFGQATVTFSERLDVTGGVRYDHESKELENRHTFAVGGTNVLDESADFDEDFDEVLPMANLAYHFTEELLVYGLAARGFKAGGFNLTAPAGRQSFDAETNWTYEVGVKKAFGDRARIGLAAFYIDWDDMQLSLFDATAGGYVANAGESTSKGVEVEGEVTVYDGWTVFTGFGFTDTEFDEFTDPFGTDVSGNDLPFAPETLWNVGSEYQHRFGREGHWFVRGALTDVGEFFYDAGNLEDESYQLVDFSAGLRQRRWDLDFWIRNAFDEEYVSVAFQPNPFDPTAFVGENGPPQTFGFTLNVYL